MLLDELKTGDRLEISIKQDNGLGKVYISQVEQTFEDMQVAIMVPISYGKLVKLPVGSGYSLLFFTEKGMYRCDATIVKYYREDKFNLVLVKLDTEGERMQRRNFYRFHSYLPMKFSIVDEEGFSGLDDEIEVSQMYDGITKDIGGGGIRFVTNQEVDGNALINCIILLGDEYCVALAKILYTLRFPKAAYKFQYRAKFVGILPSEQEKIIQYIFNEQRKRIKVTM